ncbi:MAG TPA: YafY family protein [Candidatus Saccharimonadia bacterium]|nr:YafY family protein [Candidatus Saccharimonadia bacterium]
MNRIDRLTGMILLLQGQRVITAETIAEHFEISVRTVYRDLAALGEAGVPIVAEAGIGYSLMRGYHMPPIMFTEDEATALFLSGEVTEQVADDSLRQALRSAMLKVKSVLSQEKRDYLQKLGQSVGVRLRRSNGAARHEALMPIQDATVKRRCLAISYNTANRGAITERIVEPLGVVYYAREWHLLAWCRMRQEVRDFRLDRIQTWHLLDEVFHGHEDFSIKDFLRRDMAHEEVTSAVVIAQPFILDRLLNELPGTPVARHRLDDGRVRLELLTFSLEWLGYFLLGYGVMVEAVEPTQLRTAVRTAALAVAERYAADFSES